VFINVDKNDTDIGKRLDLFLSLKLPNFTRSFIKKVIESNQLLLNGEVFYKAGYKVKGGESIRFPEIEMPKKDFDLVPSSFDLEILYEDQDYLIINKPIGLLVHPSNQHQTDTVVNKLLGYYDNLPKNAIHRPGIVHRLDRDTSGVLVIAKTPKSLWWSSKEFADRRVHKVYLSISFTMDKPNFETGSVFKIDGYIYRSTTQTKKYQISKDSKKGRYSLSNFKILHVGKLFNCNVIISMILPVTGRTHQIRVHQKSRNFPILGDKLYLPETILKETDQLLQNNNIENRLYLHAYSINFENYDGKKYSVKSQIPQGFLDIFKLCGLEAKKIAKEIEQEINQGR
jgi:23S rRNA pseudouridine1911/1915/1917 synthase